MGIGEALDERRGVLALGAGTCCGGLEPGKVGSDQVKIP